MICGRTSAKKLWKGPFVRPVPDAANSAFGTRIILNGQARSPHSGADFISAAGTPIKAPNGGRVVLAGDRYFTGNTVMIDHGLTVFSLFAHLSEIEVKVGDVVHAGDDRQGGRDRPGHRPASALERACQRRADRSAVVAVRAGDGQ